MYPHASMGQRTRFRPRRAQVLAIAATTLALLGGCGGQSDQQAIRAKMTQLGHATASKDYATLCDKVLAPALTSAIVRVGLACPAALSRGLGGVKNPQLVVRSIRVSGSTALVAVHTSAANQTASDDTVELIKTGAGWRVSRLAGG